MLLFAVHGGCAKAFLFDRSFEVVELGGCREAAAEFCRPKQMTLLDGELLDALQVSASTPRPPRVARGTRACQPQADGSLARSPPGSAKVYMAFDAVQWFGEDVGSQPLARREAVCMEARSKWRSFCQRCGAEGKPQPPLRLLNKKYADLQDVAGLLRCISRRKVMLGGDGQLQMKHVHQHGPERLNVNDGVVFTPAACSYAAMMASGRAAGAEQPALLKWKPAAANTVDFVLLKSELQAAVSRMPAASLPSATVAGLQLHTGLPLGRTQAVATATLSFNACRRLLASSAAAATSGQEHLVVECAYDAQNSCWRVAGLRPDKNTPNFITTAWNTLELLVENITPAELASACSAAAQQPLAPPHPPLV